MDSSKPGHHVYFSKMHGAGNDFIVTDNRAGLSRPPDPAFIRKLCHRKLGIGADGFIFLSSSCADTANFRMFFFNCDGRAADMCGNGMRCAVLYARKRLGGPETLCFETDAGFLKGEMPDTAATTVTIQIPCLQVPLKKEIDAKVCYYVNTGVPHLVVVSENIADIDLKHEGKYLRNHPEFSPAGSNVDFIDFERGKDAPVLIRTYERGVEAETSACGTGIAAAALSLFMHYNFPEVINFNTIGNDLLTVDLSGFDK